MKFFRLLSPLVLFALLFAGCGGGSPSVSSDDVAVVGGTHITQQQFNDLLAVQKASMKAQGQAFPAAGSTQYAQLRSNLVNVLVQETELQQEAKKLGIAVSPAEVQKQLASIKKTQFGGSDKKYEAELKKDGFTD